MAPSLIGDCPTSGCGLNGVWLGDGVNFRTLHLDGAPNPQGLGIRGFRSGAVELRLEIHGDEVVGVKPDGRALTGKKLVGAELRLAGTRFDQPTHATRELEYTFRIEDFRDDEDYWATCNRGADCSDAPQKVRLYKFSVTTNDGCRVEFCKAGLSTRYGTLNGEAVIFRGDYYDEDTYHVRDVPLAGEDDVFNIACVGTSISKLHLLRHTTASQGSRDLIGVPQREAMLRLLTADYCGIGHSFTETGHPIRLGFRSPRWHANSSYDLASASTVDALWTSAGASCLAMPRLASDRSSVSYEEMMRQIRSVCGSRMPSSCTPPLAPELQTLLRSSSDAISGNP